MPIPRFFPTYAAALVLSAGLASGAAMAQNVAPPQAPTPITSPTDAQLDKYAGAVRKVAKVADEYRPKLEAAQDQASREAILTEADAKMVELVQADGMTVEEYNGISMAVRQDPQLRQRVMDKMNQQGGGATR